MGNRIVTLMKCCGYRCTTQGVKSQAEWSPAMLSNNLASKYWKFCLLKRFMIAHRSSLTWRYDTSAIFRSVLRFYSTLGKSGYPQVKLESLQRRVQDLGTTYSYRYLILSSDSGQTGRSLCWQLARLKGDPYYKHWLRVKCQVPSHTPSLVLQVLPQNWN